MPDNEEVAQGTPEVDIKAAIEAETANLKAHNEKIIAEKRSMKQERDELASTLERLGGKDGVERLLKWQERVEQDETAKMIAEGRYEEVIEQRTASLKANYGNQVEALTSKATEAEERAQKAESRYQDLILEVEVRDACTRSEGFVDSAVVDALSRARGMFEYDPELNRPVVRDGAGGVLPGKDGTTPKSIAEWLDEQKKESRHWWGGSNGAGAEGGRVAGSAEDRANALRGAKTQREFMELRKQEDEKNQGRGFAGHKF